MEYYGYYNPILDQVVNSFYELRELYPNVSLPQNMDIPSLNWYRCILPDYPTDGQSYQISDHVVEQDGLYYRVWEVVA